MAGPRGPAIVVYGESGDGWRRGGYDRAMISDRDTYDEAEWAASVGHGPLLASKPGEAFLIYRHWIWANLQRISFEQSFKSKETFDPPEMVMVGRGPIFMFVWYGLLWSVIEAIEGRRFDLRGPLRTTSRTCATR